MYYLIKTVLNLTSEKTAVRIKFLFLIWSVTYVVNTLIALLAHVGKTCEWSEPQGVNCISSNEKVVKISLENIAG